MLKRIWRGLRRRLRPAGGHSKAPDAPQPRPRVPAPARPAPAAKPSAVSQFAVPPAAGKTRFHDLHLPVELLHAIADLGFRYCTPIQAAIMPALLAGRDAAGQAQTGTGKTAAFLISMFTLFLRRPPEPNRRTGAPRALVLAPTRELAVQIEKEAAALSRYTDLRTGAVYGGMDYDKQRRRLLERPLDVVVATPGRLLDFLGKGAVRLDGVEVLVIDEADRMLDMGFIPDVRRIVRATPPKGARRTWLFSATLSPEVMRLAGQWLAEPLKVEIEPEQVAAESVRQLVYIVTARDKFALLYHFLTQETPGRVLVFCNRRDETDRLAQRLRAAGIECGLLSGDVPQEKRMRTIESFRDGRLRVLVATDVAGRGIHIEGISHVINYNLPFETESYVHRIGRTGRAGREGVSISFACEDESFALPEIEAFIGAPLTYRQPDPAWLKLPADVARRLQEHRPARAERSGPPRRGGGGGPRTGRRGPARRR